MKKTLTRCLLAIVMMASMIMAMVLPASAASYKLKLEIQEIINSANPGAGESIIKGETAVSDSTNLTGALYELLLTGLGEMAGDAWDFNIDEEMLDKILEEGIPTEEDEWDEWLKGFEDDMAGIQGGEGLLKLIKNNVTVGSMEDGTYTMTYTPVVNEGTDPANVKSYTFKLTRESVIIGGGGGTQEPPTTTDPKPETPDTPNVPTVSPGGSGNTSTGTPNTPSGSHGGGGGTSTSTPNTPSGSHGGGGSTSAEAPDADDAEGIRIELPDSTVSDAVQSGVVVTLSVEMGAVSDSAITIVTNTTTPIKVKIPVAPTTSGLVAVLVKEDGTEQIIRDSVVTEDGVVTAVSNGDKIVIKDNTKTFNDVTDAHWGKDAVAFVTARGLFAGVGNNNFAPDVTTNRGMIAQVLHNLEYNVENHGDGHSFPDVQDHHWYNDAVHWAKDRGIVGGYGDGTFKGEKEVTREELVVMLWNYAGKPAGANSDYVNGFNDAETVSDWALNAMNWALENGVLGGKGGKILDPAGLATRAELAQMMKNFISNL